jgi:hypothetical protein
MNKLILSIATTAIVFAPISAMAGPIQERINRQDNRIYNGVKNGSLTPKEYRILERKEDSIQNQRDRFIRSGGKFTKAEKRHINHRLNRQSERIYNYKHN